ncbi:MAG: mannose-1-phosphate guanylyltransferase, partial [Spirochaetota bacterium]
MTNIILCGGSGTRLWPLSRSLYPKQFVKILKDRSLFQLTVERNRSLCDSTVIVTNEKLHFMALDQIDHESADETDISFPLEGVGRNTAPAIAIACFGLDPDECVFVTPSDHMISDTEEYHRMVTEARSAASAGMLVTFGINPSYPETGYGYIESDTAGKLFENTYRVRAFREKPDEETAKRYVQSDGYYWNSGMFVFTAGSFLNELEAYSPEIFKTSKHAYETCVVGSYNGFYSRYVSAKEMNNIPSDSID